MKYWRSSSIMRGEGRNPIFGAQDEADNIKGFTKGT